MKGTTRLKEARDDPGFAPERFSELWEPVPTSRTSMDRLGEDEIDLPLPVNVDRLHFEFETALKHHETGALSEAHAAYLRVLELDSNHVETLHMLGLLYFQAGNPEQGLPLVDRAIAHSGSAPEMQNTRGIILRALGRPAESLAAYQEALRGRPHFADAAFNLGNLLLSQDEIAAAIDAYERALQCDGSNADAWFNLGAACQRREDWRRAIGHYRRALNLQSAAHPDSGRSIEVARTHAALGGSLARIGEYTEAETHFNLALQLDPTLAEANAGCAELQLHFGHPRRAAALYRRAIAEQPDRPEFHHSLGRSEQAAERYSEAIAAYERAVALDPDLADSLCNLAVCHQQCDQLDAALDCCARAIRVDPKHAGAWINRGITLRYQERNVEALQAYDMALALAPESIDVLVGRGAVYSAMARPRDAIADYDRALRIAPDHSLAHWNRSLARLQLGDFRGGWEEFEWRWKWSGFRSPRRHADITPWRGESIRDQPLLLHAEQGFGDTIQFIRYAALAAERAGQILVEAPAPLCRLLRAVPSVSEVVATGSRMPSVAAQVPLMSLPNIFGTELGTIPAETPYFDLPPTLTPPMPRVSAPNALHVGICWKGQSDARRNNLPLRAITRWCRLPRIVFYGLQVDASVDELRELAGCQSFHHVAPGFNDFLDTALFIRDLDLVISVDTAVAHLTGALGRPAWILLRHASEWRWLLDREDSPWYPGMKLFRQTHPGDWEPVIESVRAALSNAT